MSSRDISEAMAFERMEPFGDRRADFRAASIAHTVAVSGGVKKSDGSKLSIKDFLLDFSKKPESVTDKIKEVFGKWRH